MWGNTDQEGELWPIMMTWCLSVDGSDNAFETGVLNIKYK